MKKQPKILYFIAASSPTEEEMADAETLVGAKVMFRNFEFVDATSPSMEDCDGVAGDVPANYAAKFPPAEEVLEERKASRAKAPAKAPEKAAATPSTPKAPAAPAAGAPGWQGGK